MAVDITELLRMFRALEANEDAIPVLGDEDAMKILSVWSKTDQRWTSPKKKPPAFTPNRHAELWQWICSGWHVDESSIVVGSGLSAAVVHTKIRMLMTSRLIYPDGEMSKAARTALQVFIANKLGIKAKRKPDDAAGGGKVGN